MRECETKNKQGVNFQSDATLGKKFACNTPLTKTSIDHNRQSSEVPLTMSRQGLEERDLSTSLADLSIDQDQQPHQPLPSSTSSSRKERAFGLLQDESMNLISGFGGDDSTLGVGGGFQVVGGDDSFYGDEEEEEQDQTLRRLPQRTVVPETEEEENGESRLGGQRERVKAVEFGGSMAASTSRRFYEPTTTTSGTTGKRTESQGEKGNANDRMLEEAGEEYEDEDSDELLILEDENCSAQDKERIKQLRNEREELRGMNKVLRQVVLALKTTESNINVSFVWISLSLSLPLGLSLYVFFPLKSMN